MSDILFAYGSLMCADIMKAVSGTVLEAVPATLCGFQRYAVRGEEYPGIVPQSDFKVDGIAYAGLNKMQWQRLDAFEGDEYRRERVMITINGKEVSACTYVVRVEFRYRLSNQRWDYEDFLKHGKQRFYRQYPGFDGVRGK